MFAFTREERLVLITLGVVVALGVSTNYFLKVSPLARDLLNTTNNYERYLRLDINRATYDELVAVPQIGPKTAERIMAYREVHGPFTRLEDLKKVGGIGHLKLKTVERYFVVTTP